MEIESRGSEPQDRQSDNDVAQTFGTIPIFMFIGALFCLIVAFMAPSQALAALGGAVMLSLIAIAAYSRYSHRRRGY